jgi:hypothetical protein
MKQVSDSKSIEVSKINSDHLRLESSEKEETIKTAAKDIDSDDEDDLPLHLLASKLKKQNAERQNEKKNEFIEESNQKARSSPIPKTHLTGIYDFLHSDTFMLTIDNMILENKAVEDMFDFSFFDENDNHCEKKDTETEKDSVMANSPIIDLIKPKEGDTFVFSMKNLKRKLKY